MKRRFISAVASISVLFSSAFTAPNYISAEDSNLPYQMEYLDRGTVAVKTDNGVYISWRLLGTENYDTAFDVYRDGEYIATVTDSTNYTDSTAGNNYTVVPAGESASDVRAVSVWDNQYTTIPLDRPDGGVSLDGEEYTYSANDVTPADVDGDGEYELILKWEPSNSFDSGKDAKHNGNVYIDCYKLSGEKLWRIDMGININAGQHFTQIAAYDFDLDGKAELAMKTAPGTIDGQGDFVSKASSFDEIYETDNSADYRCSINGEDTGGRVLSGPEYYTVFQGDTGAAIDTIFYPHPRGTIAEWGDNWGNRSERYLTAVAYLDGKTPSMIAWRGYYEKTTATAYNLVNGKLVKIADFTTDNPEYSPYVGQGNHNLTVGDVDADGCDEIICGSICLDNDFSLLWCSGRGHGDALHLGNYDPSHNGLEYFSVHEDFSANEITASTTGNNGSLLLGGMTLYAAEDGEELFHADGYGDTGRGMMANVGYSNGYFEFWGSGSYASYGLSGIAEESYSPSSSNFRIFWDGDLYDELLDGTGSYNCSFGIDKKDGRLQTLNNAISNNYTKNTPCLTADLFGDWREEIVVRGSDNESLLVYTTTIETEHKLYTLMHDRTYRMQVACQNAGYNQPPHIGYYVDNDNGEYDERKYAAYVTTVHDGKTSVRTENLPPEKTDIVPTPMPTPAPESYFTVDDNGIITGYSGTYQELDIPETIQGITVTGIGDRVFYNNGAIKSVTMPDTIKTIGEYAFSGCEFTSVILSNTLEDIGTHAFDGCCFLTSVQIPSSVRTIGDYAFAGDEVLSTVKLNEGLEEIGRNAFASCASLVGISLPNTLVSIGAQAFYNDTALESINVPDGVTTLESGTFMYCTSLKSAVIGENTVKIEGTVFCGCTALSEINLPDTLTSIGYGAFKDCTALSQIELPEGLTVLEGKAFSGCTSLAELIIPSTLSEIPEQAAYKCTSLTSIHIPEGVISIGKQAFANCSGICEITLSDSVTEIGENAFGSCKSLEGITLMPTVTEIGKNAFTRCAQDFTIYGYTNSQAYKYANSNSINFVSIGYIDRVIPTLPPMAACAPEDDIQITTGDATEITETSAVLNGTISEGYFLDYYYIAADNENDEELHALRCWGGYEDGSFPVTADNLLPATKYIFYAFNDSTQTRGDIKEFVTLGATPVPTVTPKPTVIPQSTETPTPEPTNEPSPSPTAAPDCKVTTKAATDITATTATLNGELEIYTNGAKNNLYYRFWAEGSEETKYVYASADTEPPYQGYIKGLTPNTVYYYYAYNADIVGETMSFVTMPENYNYPYRITSDYIDNDTHTFMIARYESNIPAVMFCAQYTSDGSLANIETVYLSGDEEEVFSVEFSKKYDTFKVFIWDINTLEPKSEVYQK